MLIVSDIKLPPGVNEAEAFAKALKSLGVGKEQVEDIYVHKLSVDARKGKIGLVYSIAVELYDKEYSGINGAFGENVRLVNTSLPSRKKAHKKPDKPVIVCGMGPAGLFAALELAKAGIKTIVLEQGPDIEKRRTAVEEFEKSGKLNTQANIQFGEGGAGTFSDGKLISRIGGAYKNAVMQKLVEAGAPKEILYMAKPHIGTDLLCSVFVNLRQELISLGAEIMFETKLNSVNVKKGRLISVESSKGEIKCSELVLAVGNSARDIFSHMPEIGVEICSKPFSVGFRIEHLQRDVDESLYHTQAGNPALPPGEYQLSEKLGKLGVYTFCMCPGGTVVAAASEENGVVTNGMSRHARDGKNANSAVVVGVGEDFNNPLEGVGFQRSLEGLAYQAGGGGYAAPAESLGSFLSGRGRLEIGRVEPSYPRGVREASLSSLLPQRLNEALKQGILSFGRKMKAFTAQDAILTGLETRTSSPVRIIRNDSLESNVRGIWPCGEGAGYAGGITSAAVDGIKVSAAIIDKYSS